MASPLQTRNEAALRETERRQSIGLPCLAYHRAVNSRSPWRLAVRVVCRVALAGIPSGIPVIAAAQSAPAAALDTRVLQRTTVKRPLTSGQRHAYSVEAQRGDYVDVQLEQRGIDVVVSVRGPDGRPKGEFDNPTGALGLEPVRFIAEVTGTHLLETRALQPEAEPGSYTIRLSARRPATAADRRLAAAVHAQQDADRLRANADTRRQSLQRYREAIDLCHEVPDPSGEAAALRAMGFAHIRLGEDAEAMEVFQDLRGRWRTVRDRRSEAYTLLIIGTILRRRGDLEQSLAMDQAALPLWREARDREQEAFTLATLGTTHARIGGPEQYERLHTQGLSVARRAKSRALEAAMFRSLANARQQLGNSSGALMAHSQALALWQQIGHRRGQATTLLAMAAIQEDNGDRDRALDSLNRATVLWDELGAAREAADTRQRIEALRQKARTSA